MTSQQLEVLEREQFSTGCKSFFTVAFFLKKIQDQVTVLYQIRPNSKDMLDNNNISNNNAIAVVLETQLPAPRAVIAITSLLAITSLFGHLKTFSYNHFYHHYNKLRV